MRFCSVALVHIKAIRGKLLMKNTHHAIARDLCDYRSCGDRFHKCVSMNDAALWNGESRNRPRVNEGEIGVSDFFNRAAHGQLICRAESEQGDLFHTRLTNGPATAALTPRASSSSSHRVLQGDSQAAG